MQYKIAYDILGSALLYELSSLSVCWLYVTANGCRLFNCIVANWQVLGKSFFKRIISTVKNSLGMEKLGDAVQVEHFKFGVH